MKQLEKNYYRSCKTLPLYNFYEILNTSDLRWLIVGFNENYQDEEIDEDSDILFNIWEDIHATYSEMFGNSIDTKKYVTIAQIASMETEVYVIEKLIEILKVMDSKIIRDEIDAWGYFSNDYEKSNSKIDQLKFKISIFRSQNKELIEPSEEVEKIFHDLYKDIVTVEKGLRGGYAIDANKTVVSKWVRLVLQAQENSKKNGK